MVLSAELRIGIKLLNSNSQSRNSFWTLPPCLCTGEMNYKTIMLFLYLKSLNDGYSQILNVFELLPTAYNCPLGWNSAHRIAWTSSKLVTATKRGLFRSSPLEGSCIVSGWRKKKIVVIIVGEWSEKKKNVGRGKINKMESLSLYGRALKNSINCEIIIFSHWVRVRVLSLMYQFNWVDVHDDVF